MKLLTKVFLGIGIVLLILVVAGACSANPSRFNHIKITTIILFANTTFLLAILSKMFEKK